MLVPWRTCFALISQLWGAFDAGIEACEKVWPAASCGALGARREFNAIVQDLLRAADAAEFVKSMNALRRVLAILLVLMTSLLFGCATRSPIANKDKPLFQAPNGVALLSVGFVKANERLMDVALRSTLIAVKAKRVDAVTAGGSPVNRVVYGGSGRWLASDVVLDSGDRVRAITSMELAPGDYELFAYELDLHYGIGHYSMEKKYLRPIRFTIRTGEVTYIGSHEMRMTTGQNLLGQTVPAGATFPVLDRMEEDVARLHAIRPETMSLKVNSALE